MEKIPEMSDSDEESDSEEEVTQEISEEGIFVSVRVRPLSLKEQKLKDEVAWDCNEDTIFCRSNCQNQEESESEREDLDWDGIVDDRVLVRTSTNKYLVDRAFGPTDTSEKVYDEGAKKVVLSALKGINVSVIAYGQTGSGKTFTMMAVAENAIRDIYMKIQDMPKRDFILKLSVFEVCNETVVDLLKQKLGFLTDLMPEGITVRITADDLAEVAAEVSLHPTSIVVINEAVLQVSAISGRSSRSNQIIRLILENHPRRYSGCEDSYISNVNLVDLAGSELVEGSNSDHSMSTLREVFRKARHTDSAAYAPLYGSKLTEILAESLMGNTRTAIICTMSPALSAVDQSRNTLSFARDACCVTKHYVVNKIDPQNDDVKFEAKRQSPDHTSSPRLMVRIREMKKKLKDFKIMKRLSVARASHYRRSLAKFRNKNDALVYHIFKLENRLKMIQHQKDQLGLKLKRTRRRYKKICRQVSLPEGRREVVMQS